MQFTPTEERILKVLADGDRHWYDKLLPCLEDPMSNRNNLQQHIYNLRQKLRKIKHDIICEVYDRRCYYRHITILQPSQALVEPDLMVAC